MSKETLKRNMTQLSLTDLTRAYAYKSKLGKPGAVFKRNKEEKTQRYALIIPLDTVVEYDEEGNIAVDENGNKITSKTPVNTTAVIAKANLSMDFDRSANIIYAESEYEVTDDLGEVISDISPLKKYYNSLQMMLLAKEEKELAEQREKDVNSDPIIKETNLLKIRARYSWSAAMDYAKKLFPNAKDDVELRKNINSRDDFPKRRSFLESPYAVRLTTAALVPLTTNNVIKPGTSKETIDYVYIKLNKNLIRHITDAVRKQPALVSKNYVCLISQYNVPANGEITGLSIANFYENMNAFDAIGIPGIGDASAVDTKVWDEIIKGLIFDRKDLLSKINEYSVNPKARYSGISTTTAIERIKEFIANQMGIFDDIKNIEFNEDNKYFAKLLVTHKNDSEFTRLKNSSLITRADALLNDNKTPDTTPLTKAEEEHIKDVVENPGTKYEDDPIVSFS